MLGRHRRADVKDTHTLAAPTMKRVTLDAISEQSNQAALYAGKSVNRIRKITNQMQMLALNAKIEAAKAGQFGRGFSVVAAEVGLVGEEINTVAQDIQSILSQRLSGLNDMVAQMEKDTLGDRLVDLAFTAVDTIDRNLYERTCDVRWWATDSSFVTALQTMDLSAIAHATRRLGVILDAYNIYLDLWICDLEGRVIANARPNKYDLSNLCVREFSWFKEAVNQVSGDEFSVGEVVKSRALNDDQCLSYACAIRENGDKHGKVLGVMASSFDWEAQARSVVGSLRMDETMARRNTHVLLIDRQNRVIASSDGLGFLTERISFPPDADYMSGWYTTDNTLVAYHSTNGFETYAGLGWKGVVTQDLR